MSRAHTSNNTLHLQEHVLNKNLVHNITDRLAPIAQTTNSLHIFVFPFHRHSLHVRPHDTSRMNAPTFARCDSNLSFSPVVFSRTQKDIRMVRLLGKVSSSNVHGAVALEDLRCSLI